MRWQISTVMQDDIADGDNKTDQVLNNYFSMGFADAKIALGIFIK